MLSDPVAEQVLAGNETRGRDLLERQLLMPVAAGIGVLDIIEIRSPDPDLLTLRALQRRLQADVVFYEPSLAGPLLQRARREARLVCMDQRAGARRPYRTLAATLARQGQRICYRHTAAGTAASVWSDSDANPVPATTRRQAGV